MGDNRLRNLNYPKAILTCLLAVYGFICAKDPASYHMIDGVNLISHEAGHLLLGYFGEFIGVLGGTAGQLFVPAAFTAYFVRQRSYFSAAATLFWLGQNMFNISVYIKDASVMELPLVSTSGGEAIHDWNYMLLKLGMLSWDRIIGNIVYGSGLIIIFIAVLAGFFFSFDKTTKSPQLS